MTFPRRLLIQGEDVILDLRPHWISLILPALVAVASLVVATIVFGLIDASWWRWLVEVAALVALLSYPVPRLVWWLTSNFVLTTDRLVHREGFIAKRSMEIPLEAINDVRFEQGIIDRIVNAGSVAISSASEQGRQVFENVRNPEEVQKSIYHQGEMNSRRMLGGTQQVQAGHPAAPPTPPIAPSTTTELERLAKLRADGVLTEEEFQAQKAKILGS